MRNKIIKILTVVVVFILIANPEYFLLGMFIDGVGLEVLFMLMGVQIVSISKDYYDRTKRCVVIPMKSGCVYAKARAITTFTTSIEPIIMRAIALSAAIGCLG